MSGWTPSEVLRQQPALVEELKQADVTLFVGAGLSRNAGYPLWGELLAPLRAELGLGDDISPVMVAQYYVNSHAQGRHLLSRHVISELTKTESTFSLAHALIKELPLRAIITTNFDQLIERTLASDPPRRHSVVIDDTDLPYAVNTDRLTVIKANGCVSRPGSLVLTQDDFESYTDNKPGLTNLLKTLLATSTFLFIGTSFREPAFSNFNAEVLRRLGEHRRTFYMVMPTANKYEVEDYQRRGIEAISLGAGPEEIGNEVTKLLESLAQLASPAELRSDKAAGRGVGEEGDGISRGQLQLLDQRYQTLLVSRLGTGLSLQVNPDHVDRFHRYSLVDRTDLLDYTSGNFVSIRRLCGVNVADRLSSHVVYSESSEKKLTFAQTNVAAFDTSTREPLVVEPFVGRDRMMFTHAYRLFFQRPLSPGETFDIVHRIELPGELEVLSPENEIMSISLARILHRVDRLKFSVCLNFRPRSVAIECLDGLGARVPTKNGAPVVEAYQPAEWYESALDIEWTSEPYVIRWTCQEPDSSLYIVNYRA